MKKSILWVLVIIITVSMVAVLSLGGCKTTEKAAEVEEETAEVEEETAEVEEEAAEVEEVETVELKLWDWLPEEKYNNNFLLPALKEFREEFPHVTIEVDHIPSADYLTQLKVAFASGSGPDILGVWQGALGYPLIEAGNLLDLTDLIGNDTEMMNYLAGAVDYTDMYYNDRIWQVPVNVGNFSVLYNKNIFKSLNLEIPTTLDEMIEVAETLKENDIIPISIGFTNRGYVSSWINGLISATEPGLFDKLNAGEVSWNHPTVKFAIETLVDFYNRGFLPANVLEIPGYPEAAELLFREEAAMYFPASSGFPAIIPQEQLDSEMYSVFPWPKTNDNGQTAFMGGVWFGFGVNSYSKHQEESYNLVKWFVSPINQQRMFDIGKITPGETNTEGAGALQAAIQEAQQNGPIITRYYSSADVENTVIDECIKLMLGESDIDTALTKIDDASKE